LTLVPTFSNVFRRFPALSNASIMKLIAHSTACRAANLMIDVGLRAGRQALRGGEGMVIDPHQLRSGFRRNTVESRSVTQLEIQKVGRTNSRPR
jgi:hypothetical protein